MPANVRWLCVAFGLCVFVISVRMGERRTFAQESPLPSTSTGQLGISPEEPVEPPKPIIVRVPQQAPAKPGAKGQPVEAPVKFVAPAIPDPDPNNPVAVQSTNLLKLAYNLKSEVDKTTKDTLSVAVVRQASEIEQLARKMRTR